MRKTEITLHHTSIYANKDTEKQFDIVDKRHKDRWGGRTLSDLGHWGGYHYLCERDGTVKQFRNDDEVGAHNKAGIKRIGFWKYSANYYAIGIAFAGNMSRQQLTTAQVRTGVELVKRLQGEYDISDKNVLGHRDYTPTQCPGNNIPDKVWEYLQEQYEKFLQKQPAIIRWSIKNKIIEDWEGPTPEWKMVLAWVAYKSAKAIVCGKLKKEDFNL